MNIFVKSHQFLLPKEHDIGFSAYVILAFLGMFFFHFYFKPVQGIELGIVVAGVITFLVCYFRAYWCQGKALFLYIVAICLIGSAMASINSGASVFFVYAAGFCCGFSPRAKAFLALVFVLVFVVVFTLLTNQGVFFWFSALFFSCIIGLLNIHQVEVQNKNKALKQSQQEIQQIAATAERERISRDLHDLLGHSLSVITLKAELASKMIDKGMALSKINDEIKAVETLSRTALAQVRGAVSGYNKATIAQELLQASVATQAAGITLIENIDVCELPPEVESELALIIRESITNVIRHADTKRVQVNLTKHNNQLTLTIIDQGQIPAFKENSGIQSMRSRINNIGGQMQLIMKPNTQLQFTLALV
ncbi:sensor histidine kinase [Colwellia sp. KU-HH00111]|uniref:sensor histidine kinase n=1 Tax=Colwellia sp. KU-HH00111 TaxID=3127652 RepID=UPI0031070F4F